MTITSDRRDERSVLVLLPAVVLRSLALQARAHRDGECRLGNSIRDATTGMNEP